MPTYAGGVSDEEEYIDIIDVKSSDEPPLPSAPEPPFAGRKLPKRPGTMRWTYVSFAFHAVWLIVALLMVTYVARYPAVMQSQQEEMNKSIEVMFEKLNERIETKKVLIGQRNDSFKPKQNLLNQSRDGLSYRIRTLPVYEQELTTSKYLYQENMPDMTEMTICFWFSGENEDDRVNDYLVNIGLPDGDQLSIGWSSNGDLQVWIKGEGEVLARKDKDELWVGWNKHCFTWKAGGKAKWYTSKLSNGLLELVSTANLTLDTISYGGYLTILQEQDRIGGNFDIRQTVTGKIAEFNIWDFEMNIAQLNTRSCGKKGNVASWDTLQKDKIDGMTTAPFPSCYGEVNTTPVYTQERSTSDYLYQSNLSGMSESTTCFWYYGPAGTNRNSIYLVSIATPEESNEFIIGWDKRGDLAVEIHEDSMALKLAETDNMSDLWDFWHKHCFTWKAGGLMKWYSDRDTDGSLDLIASVEVTNKSIRSGGIMVLLQEQDSFGGGLDIDQVATGKIAEFNMWDYEMNQQQLNSKTCGTKGNVASDDTLEQQGTLYITDKAFPSCYERNP